MYTAKEAHSGFEIYSAEQHEYSPDRLALVGELRRAIDEKELLLHYQPKASLETGRIIGVEGLVRWQHPRRGMLRPDEFVGLAEHTSLISPLTLFVLEEAIVQCRRWQKEGHKLTVAVNLSVRNLMDRQLPKDVARLLEKHSLSPDRLELEITESMVMSEPRRALAVLCELSDMGIALSIDDFGTGYSSLAYLKKLPVQAIKIDKSFVMDMIEDADNGMIVQSTVDLGQNLGLKVVAEGVESEEAWRRLAAMGCDTAQGFFLAKPLPVEELMSFILGRAPATDEPARTYAAPQTVAAPQPLRAV
jgi:EAL domain-containing protein (putative c-di-GMP-specific phosphodiesterase class I)